jgi:Tol biopolymer transport system component
VSDRYTWSRDGTRVAFVVGDSLFAYSADNGEPELLSVHAVETSAPHSLAWSPDGRLLAYVNRNLYWRFSVNVANASIWILDADGGEPVPVTDEAHLNVSPQWLPDSRHLLFVSNRDGPRGIYVVEVGPEGPRGTPRSVLSSSDPHSISVSADGRRLAFAKFPGAQNIWAVPIPQAGVVSIRAAVPVTAGTQVVESHSLSPDGEWIVFDSNRRGEFDIYKQPLEGGSQQLIADITGHAFAPDWSSVGAEIAFYARSEKTGGGGEVFVLSGSGGAPEQLTDFPGNDDFPDWSPDGLAIAYHSMGPQGAGPQGIWLVSRDSLSLPWNDPVQLTDFGCALPDWAPDGASLVCRTEAGWVRVSEDAEVLSRYDPTTAGIQSFTNLQFSSDGSRLYVVGAQEDGSRGVWWIPVDGGDATKVVAFDDPSLTVAGYLTVGPEDLYLTISEYESDIWVMDLDW